MKKIILQLEKQLEKLNELIDTRDDYILEMSEKWQESEKCEEYEDKTIEISEKADDLDQLISELKQLV